MGDLGNAAGNSLANFFGEKIDWICANLFGFGQNQNLASPKTFNRLRLCQKIIHFMYKIQNMIRSSFCLVTIMFGRKAVRLKFIAVMSKLHQMIMFSFPFLLILSTMFDIGDFR